MGGENKRLEGISGEKGKGDSEQFGEIFFIGTIVIFKQRTERKTHRREREWELTLGRKMLETKKKLKQAKDTESSGSVLRPYPCVGISLVRDIVRDSRKKVQRLDNMAQKIDEEENLGDVAHLRGTVLRGSNQERKRRKIGSKGG